MSDNTQQPVQQVQQPQLPVTQAQPTTTAQAQPARPVGRSITDAPKTSVFNPEVYKGLQSVATSLIQGQAFPAGLDTVAKVLTVMQFGYELGMPPITSVQSLYIVKGKIVIYGQALTSRLTQKGYNIDYQEAENECEVTVNKGNKTYKEKYTFKMAEDSGFTRDKDKVLKTNWLPGVNRILKLRYGALSMLLKSRLAHLLQGAEIKEVAEDFEIPTVEQAAVVADKQLNLPPRQKSEILGKLDELETK